MHMWPHVTNHLIISTDKDFNSENRITLRVRDSPSRTTTDKDFNSENRITLRVRDSPSRTTLSEASPPS
jgi:hypothetical protein